MDLRGKTGGGNPLGGTHWEEEKPRRLEQRRGTHAPGGCAPLCLSFPSALTHSHSGSACRMKDSKGMSQVQLMGSEVSNISRNRQVGALQTRWPTTHVADQATA